MVWGGTFALIKNALVYASPLLFNAVRMVLAGLCLLLVFRKEIRRLTGEAVRAGVLVGVFLWLGFELQTSGLRLTTPSKSAFLTGISIVLVPLLLALGWRRRISGWTVLGVGTAFCGLYLMTVPGSGFLELDFRSINRGDLLTLACAVAFALHIISMGWATAKHPFQQIATLQAVAAAVLMLLTLPAVAGRIYWHWSALLIAAILITGLLNTAAGFGVQAWAQQFTPPTHTALIFSLEPVFAWITSYILLQERLGVRATVGAVLIFGGVLISELKGSVAGPESEPHPVASMAD
jgi:drug/metabolite transporter (DMT)-like permease